MYISRVLAVRKEPDRFRHLVRWSTLEVTADPNATAALSQSHSEGPEALIPGDVVVQQLIAEGLFDEGNL